MVALFARNSEWRQKQSHSLSVCARVKCSVEIWTLKVFYFKCRKLMLMLTVLHHRHGFRLKHSNEQGKQCNQSRQKKEVEVSL